MTKHLAGAAVALGMVATVPTTVVNTSDVSIKTIEPNKLTESKQTNKENSKSPFSSERSMKITARKVEETSGYKGFGYDIGIPPKIYGMYHVKRGTHKRTNV